MFSIFFWKNFNLSPTTLPSYLSHHTSFLTNKLCHKWRWNHHIDVLIFLRWLSIFPILFIKFINTSENIAKTILDIIHSTIHNTHILLLILNKLNVWGLFKSHNNSEIIQHSFCKSSMLSNDISNHEFWEKEFSNYRWFRKS